MYRCTSHLPLASLGWKGAASWQKIFSSMCIILNRAMTNPASNSTNKNSTTCLDSLFQSLQSHTFIKVFLNISTAAVCTYKLQGLSGSPVQCNFSQFLCICKCFQDILYVGLCLFQFGCSFLPDLFLPDILLLVHAFLWTPYTQKDWWWLLVSAGARWICRKEQMWGRLRMCPEFFGVLWKYSTLHCCFFWAGKERWALLLKEAQSECSMLHQTGCLLTLDTVILCREIQNCASECWAKSKASKCICFSPGIYFVCKSSLEFTVVRYGCGSKFRVMKKRLDFNTAS